MQAVRNLVVAAMAALALLLAAGAAEADVCADLNAQLRSAGGGGSSAARRAAAQAAQLRSQLAQTQMQARQHACTGFALFRQRSPYCPQIMSQMSRLQSQLNAAEARLAQAGGQSGGGARARILRAMAANGCYAQQPQRQAPQERQASSGGGRGVECVRLCDGYSFPLGGSVSRNELDQAQQACQARCPGAEMRLYTPRGSREADMVSITGERYADLPNAFAYLQRYVPDCGCNPAGGWPLDAVLPGAEPASGGPATASAALPLPLPRPVMTEDPETLANRAGGFVPRPVAAPDDGPQVASLSDDADERIVRLVGPSYYYAGAASTVIGRPIPGNAAAEPAADGETGLASIEAPSDETTGSTAIRSDAPAGAPSRF